MNNVKSLQTERNKLEKTEIVKKKPRESRLM